MAKKTHIELDGIMISEIIRDAEELLGEILASTQKTDEKACLHKETWEKRHRLHVLLEAAKESQKTLPNAVVAPWFIAELKATLEIIKRWKNRPGWDEVEPALINPNNFAHTILKLCLAEHLESLGQKVELVPKGDYASPDLMLHVLDVDKVIFIECYRPSKLAGNISEIAEIEADRIVKKAVKKARYQIGDSYGIAAIGGYNISKKSINILKTSVINYLEKHPCYNLMGVSITVSGVLYDINDDGHSFNSIIQIEYIDNPNYFGSINVDSNKPMNHPNLVSSSLKDIKSEWICEGKDFYKIMLLHPSEEAESENELKVSHEDVIYKRLPLIDPPKTKERTVINGSINPLFKGNGNISCLCGQCEAPLAENIWDLSLINIVIKCPKCNAYNFFYDLDYKKFALAHKVAIDFNDYYFNQELILKRGVCLIGRYVSPEYIKGMCLAHYNRHQ